MPGRSRRRESTHAPRGSSAVAAWPPTLLPAPMDTLCRVAAARPILEVDGLARSFGHHRVLNDLTLAVEPGERIALFGPNGSGKTTFLRCVAGTLAPTNGRVRIAGNTA